MKMEQIYPYEGDADKMESTDSTDAAAIEQYSTDKKTQICNEWKCPIDGCNKICKNKTSLRQHRFEVHKRDSKDESTCYICGKVCKNKKTLWNHQRAHNRKLACDLCGNSFSKKYHLIDHIETYHIDNSKFNCTQCSKTFKSQHKLKDHQSHDVKKFKCDKCNAEFYVPGLLTEHVKMKHGGKSYHCSYPGCSKKFSSKSHAARHLKRVHKLKDDELKNYCKQLKFF